MRTLKTIWLWTLLFAVSQLQAQWLTGGNVITGVGDYLGTAAGSNQPLRLTTIPATLPIEFRTANVLRMRMNPTVSYTIGSFAAQAKNGALGLSPNNTLWVNGPGPHSRLHLHDGGTGVLPWAYRPWMDNGITFTTNNDQMYIGHKVESGTDQTSAVVQWGDNDTGPASGPDVLKFLFAGGYSGGTYGVAGLNGLELGRFHPGGWFGIGDWQSAGLQPDERLDLRDRTIRLRSFVHPTDYRNDTYDRILVTNPADGRVYWRPASTIGGGCASGWSLSGSNAVTAFNGNACTPQGVDAVGIGTNSSFFGKLHVEKDVATGAFTETGVYTHVNVGTQEAVGVNALLAATGAVANVGMKATVLNGTNLAIGFDANVQSAGTNRGLNITSSSGTNNTGVASVCTGGSITYGFASTVSNALANYGVNCVAYNGQASFGARTEASGGSLLNYGLYALASGAGATNYAGYFSGDVFTTGSYLPSDEMLKTDIAEVDIDAAPEVISQIQLHTYRYAHDQHPSMNLPEGDQLGVMAQELEALLPGLVKRAIQPAALDSMGNETRPAMEFKAVNYDGLIPHLILALQKQQARLDAMEASLAACCSNPDGQRIQLLDEGHTTPADERKLLIVPNPFSDPPTVQYTLERSGRMQLLVNSSDGKHLKVLEEGERSEGQYSYIWQTGHMAPGIYYVTLLLDGEPLVKRAVKVQ